MVEGLQHRGPGRREEVADRGRAVHVGAQHQRMDEEAYEVLQFGPVAAGGDRAEGHVPLPAPAAEEQLGGGGQQHEEAGAVLPAEPGQPGGGRGRDGEGVDRAGPGPHRGTRAVAGQLQRLQTGQPLLPVRQPLARPRVVGQAVALPGGEVGVLDRERGQRRFEAVQFGGVAGGEFTGEDVQGAAVADDVVHREQQGVPVGAEPQQQDAQERPLPQVERGQQPGAQERVRVLARRQFRLLHRDLQHGVHDLHDPAVDRVEGGPQRLVPPPAPPPAPAPRCPARPSDAARDRSCTPPRPGCTPPGTTAAAGRTRRAVRRCGRPGGWRAGRRPPPARTCGRAAVPACPPAAR
ncbi:hypothetical protein EES47_07175 [Streptomyces sp. ADI98-12]|nr:hypothetical protein EES47_07175 [Streptomyces sp. ADI98-12]